MTVVGFQSGSVVVRMMCGFNGNISADDRTLQTVLQDTICKHLDITAIATLESMFKTFDFFGVNWHYMAMVFVLFN